MLFFIQTAVAGEGPHAQGVDLLDFVAEARLHPQAAVEVAPFSPDGPQAAWLRLDLLGEADA